MNKNDILTRLMNGESAEDIAKEMTAMLNDATKAYADQKKDKEKMARAEAVADAINGYKGAELKGEDVIKVMDNFLKFYKDPGNFKIELPGFRFETNSKGAIKKGKTVDEILNDWISRI